MNKEASKQKEGVIALIALITSVLTFFFSIVLPSFEKVDIEFSRIRKLNIGNYFGTLILSKDFSVTNTGKKQGLITSISFYLAPETTETAYKMENVQQLIIFPMYDKQPISQIKALNGFSIFPKGGFESYLQFEMNKTQESVGIINKLINDVEIEKKEVLKHEKIKLDSINSKNNIISNAFYDTFDEINPAKVQYKISETLRDKIAAIQTEVLAMVKPGYYFLCEKITTSGSSKFYKIYKFYISNDEYSKFERLKNQDFIDKGDLSANIVIQVDLNPPSKEEKKIIIKRVKEYDKRSGLKE